MWNDNEETKRGDDWKQWKRDGSIAKMLLQMNNGKKIDKDCSKKMEMDGGGFKKKGRKINERNTII